MDELSAELNTFLVRLGRQPESVPHEAAHAVEHLLSLLGLPDAEAVKAYYGVCGAESTGLGDLARWHSLSPEAMMERIHKSVRRMAVSPEWQLVKAMLRRRGGVR